MDYVRDRSGGHLSSPQRVPAPVRRWRVAAVHGLPVLVIGAAAIVTLRSAGLPQDEGALVVYAERVLHGSVAHRDFESYYGPGMPWVLAGAFLVAGHHLLVERLVGLVLEITVAVAMASIGLRFGVRQGAAAGLLSAAALADVVPPVASPLLAAIALLAVSLTVATAPGPPGWRCSWRYAAAGALAALALTFRIDFAVVAAVSIAPLLVGRKRACLCYLAGAAAGLVPLAVHVVIASPGTVFGLVIVAGLHTSAARRLPLPPTDPAAAVEVAIVLASVAVDMLAAGALWLHAKRTDGVRLLAAAALLSVAVLPEILQRADVYHLLPAMAVPVALLPVSLPVLAEQRRWRLGSFRAATYYALFGALTAVAIVLAAVLENPGVPINNEGRSFPVSSGEATQARAVLADVDRIAHAGQRVFVGPMDMRRTNYTATYLYFLLPQLVPATYYLEMEPLSANGADSHLAADVASADVLVLTTEWDDWHEPNQSSSFYGSDLPNQVVARSFCLRAHDGVYRVYTRCAALG